MLLVVITGLLLLLITAPCAMQCTKYTAISFGKKKKRNRKEERERRKRKAQKLSVKSVSRKVPSTSGLGRVSHAPPRT